VSTNERKSVLVVDDDFDVRDTLSDVLADEGYVVTTASDGFEALETLRNGLNPALILLDWMMPRCDGARFRELQRADPAIAHIPVLLLTADARLPVHDGALGVQGCLIKPVSLGRLLGAVAPYLT